MTCTCSAPGYCSVFGKLQLEPQLHICRDEALTPEKCAAYRANWQRLKNAVATPDHSDCAHRGGELRRVECETCTGHIQVKVFACGVYAECTLGKRLDGIACCAGCGDYAPPVSPVTTA